MKISIYVPWFWRERRSEGCEHQNSIECRQQMRVQGDKNLCVSNPKHHCYLLPLLPKPVFFLLLVPPNFPLSLKYFSPRSDFLGGCIVSQSELICLWRKSECIRYIPSFFESGIWEEFCWMVLSWVFHEVVVKVLAGASIISGVDTSGRLASKWLTHMAVS